MKHDYMISHCYLFFSVNRVQWYSLFPHPGTKDLNEHCFVFLFFFPFVTWELIFQSTSADYYASDVHYRDTLSLRLHSSRFSPLSLTPFFLCQFPFNWTFCHQTRFITCSAVEGNGAEIRICSVHDTGPSTGGCDLAGRFPPRGASRFPTPEKRRHGGCGQRKGGVREREEGWGLWRTLGILQ